MQNDPGDDGELANLENWDEISFGLFVPTPSGIRSTAFSGHEANRLFIQNNGNFDDVSLVSGVDFREDGRGFALLDFDRDGRQDMAIVSPNHPRFRLLKNCFVSSTDDFKSVDVELIGGNDSANPTDQWSARDAFGARVEVQVGDTRRVFQLSAGEGLSSQNAKRLHIGLGEANKIDQLTVYWPSGKTTELVDVETDSPIVIFEREKPQQSR